MAEHFFEAGFRHLEAADTLFEQDQLQEAAYLSGYVAECALKTLLLQTGWTSVRDFSHSLEALSGTGFELALLLSPSYRRYRALIDAHQSWRAWRPEQRYEGNQTGASLDAMYGAATELGRSLMTALILDGGQRLP